MKTSKRKTRAKSPKRKPQQTAGAAHDVDLDTEVHHMVDDLAPTIEQLRAAQEEARAQGIFPGDRELLMCPKCGLTEDVLANGQLVTSHEADEPDTGLRFIEPKAIDEPFLCPECDGEAREVPVWIDEEPEPVLATQLGRRIVHWIRGDALRLDPAEGTQCDPPMLRKFITQCLRMVAAPANKATRSARRTRGPSSVVPGLLADICRSRAELIRRECIPPSAAHRRRSRRQTPHPAPTRARPARPPHHLLASLARRRAPRQA